MVSFFFKGEKEKYDSRNHILEDTDKDKLRLLGAIINSAFSLRGVMERGVEIHYFLSYTV